MSESVRAEVFVDMGVGETLQLDLPARKVDSEKICITLLYKSGLKARFRVDADKPVGITKTSDSKQIAPAL